MSRKYTPEQAAIVKEICEVHELDATQIGFEDDSATTPIFDYEAVCALSLRLTDIRDIDCSISDHGDADNELITAKCTVTVPDGRTRSCEGSAQLLERLKDGNIIETYQQAAAIAQARAVRRGIRSVGVNLWNAHRKFMQTGEIAAGHTRHDPRAPVYAEIHILATELDLIVDGNKEKYKAYIAENYDGRTSARDLTDMDLHRLLISFRSLTRLRRNENRRAA